MEVNRSFVDFDPQVYRQPSACTHCACFGLNYTPRAFCGTVLGLGVWRGRLDSHVSLALEIIFDFEARWDLVVAFDRSWFDVKSVLK